MRKYFKAALIIFFIFLSHLIFSYADKKIFLKPIAETKVYSNFTDRLFPFAFSKEIFFIDNETSLLLIEEYEFDNGLFKDILKVKITGGHYKGKIVYILEEKVMVEEASIKDGLYVFFKDDTVINNKIIKKDTACKIEQSHITLGEEVLTLKVIIDKKNYFYIEYKEKEQLHFMINKSSEILYQIRRGNKVVKVLNPASLLPLKDVSAGNQKSDEYGIIYIEKNVKNIILNKNGFTQSYVDLSGDDEKVFISFMEPVEFIKYYDDRTSIYKKDIFEFEINSKNKSIDNMAEIKILSQDNLSIFNYPRNSFSDYKIERGFYINGIMNFIDVNCNISIKTEGVIIIHYDMKSGKWEKIDCKRINDSILTCKIINGYYLILAVDERKKSELKIVNDYSPNISKIMIKNREGDYYNESYLKYNNEKKIMLSQGRYELLYFYIKKPEKIIQKELIIQKEITCINLIELNNDDNILKELDQKFKSNNIILSNLYHGIWKKQKTMKDNREASGQNILEFLGDIKIDIYNRIQIKTANLNGEGYLEILDDKRMLIYLTYIDQPIRSDIDNSLLKVESSLYNSQLIIPAFYSFYLNIFELSYDKIFFQRKRLTDSEDKNNKELIMESIPYGITEFPRSESETKYKIFLTKS